ncbi:hypothetical protein J2S53_004261 [Actinopolyspora lacussalsi]|nr:hypothetical protein [Actinopolyspora lacussalsi]
MITTERIVQNRRTSASTSSMKFFLIPPHGPTFRYERVVTYTTGISGRPGGFTGRVRGRPAVVVPRRAYETGWEAFRRRWRSR